MKTYLTLNRLQPYFRNTNQNFIALFGIYYLTNDINSTEQFYSNHYLSQSLGISKLPEFNELLETLANLGNQKIQVKFGKEGNLELNCTKTTHVPRFKFDQKLLINVKDYPDIELGQQIMMDIVNKVAVYHSDNEVKRDVFNLQAVKTMTLDFLNDNGYVVVENFVKKDMVENLSRVLSQIAKKELETDNAYVYGKEGRNQRIYNLLSKHIVFREILESIWIERFLDAYYHRPTFHEKYGLSSMAAHIIPPGGEDMPLHIDNAVPEPIPDNWPMRLVIVIPLCDFTKDNGTTYVVPRSHKLLKKPTPDDVNQCKGMHINAKAGSLLIWDGNLWHKSTKNNSSSERSAIVISYGASYFKEICGEEEHLVVVPKQLQENLSPRIKSLIGKGRGIKKGALYLPNYE